MGNSADKRRTDARFRRQKQLKMKRLLQTILFLGCVHVWTLVVAMLFRVALYVIEGPFEFDSSLVFDAFCMGLRFDNLMSCVLISIPVVALFFALFFKPNKIVHGAVYWYICIIYSISFFIAAVDIPYFDQFFKHVNASVWNWFDEPSFVLKMVFSEPSYFVYGIAYIIVVLGFSWVVKKLKICFLDPQTGAGVDSIRNGMIVGVSFVLIAFLCVMGIRGRLGQKSPVRIGTAYFCNEPFLNQLGLNPTYVLIRTTASMSKESKQQIHFIDDSTAISYVRNEFGIATDSLLEISPIARYVPSADSIQRKNVVIIMMESMASHFVADTVLTPFLNQLIRKSTFFSNGYSAGIHTMNGVYGTLFSFPALMNQHPFKTGDIVTYESWPTVMKQNGYTTFYFTTHDEQFDNIGGYMSANNMEFVYSEKDYPSNEVRSNLGVVDDYMFRFSMPKLTEAAQENKPFFAAFLTASNHAPHIVPEYFTPKQADLRYQVIEYSDYALQLFFEQAKQQPWYNNTIFALVGDHGAANNDYDVSLAYHHVPIIIYDPTSENPRVIPDMAGQIDIFPTVMGILGFPYINNTFGIDLMKEKRQMMFFSSDDAYCCIDSCHYYVCRNEGGESLYAYRTQDSENQIADFQGKASHMKTYAQSMIQAAQYVILQKQAKE